MGRRGPPRTPTPKLAFAGSRLAAKRAEREPIAPAGTPDTDHTLSPEAEIVFRNVTDVLRLMGLLSAADGNSLARYSSQVVRYEQADAWCEGNGDSYPVYDVNVTTKEKTLRFVRRYPQSVIRQELGASLLRLEREFGLTPAARASLTVERQALGPLAQKYLAGG